MIGFAIALVVFGLMLIIAGSATSTSEIGTFDRVVANGVVARGIVLSCDSMAARVSAGLRRFERRNVVLDVEVEGKAPYVVNINAIVPRGIVTVLPGGSLDLRVDPNNPNAIAIVGPGGFSGPWLVTAMMQSPFATSPSASSGRGARGCGFAMILVAIGIAVLYFVDVVH